MDEDEARAVIRIMLSADGGCSYCAKDLIKLFKDSFPEHANIADEMYKKFEVEI
jgi:hypothetical protein